MEEKKTKDIPIHSTSIPTKITPNPYEEITHSEKLQPITGVKNKQNHNIYPNQT